MIIGSHNLLIPGCYIYIPDEVFHDWKSIRKIMLQRIKKYVNPIKLSRFNTISFCDNTMERGVTLRYSVMICDEKAYRLSQLNFF